MSDDDRDPAIRAKLRRWREHPVSMVREEFQAEPDEWQAEGLEAFPHVNRLGFKACKGPGKTAELAWLTLNFLGTRPHSKVGCTSITGDNLDTNLWPELAKWIDRSPFFSSQFRWTKTRIEHRRYPATWFAVARAWPKQADSDAQANAIAGLHGDYAMWVGDETGGYPQGVMAAMEAVLASGIETKVLQSGNPTHVTGPLYRACTIDKPLWKIITITGDPDSPRRSPRISLEWAKQQIASYGRDNPWVIVNVLGEFPPASINALLGVEEVERAMKRHLRYTDYEWAQKRLGVDVARFGDDRTVIFPRQGQASFRPVIMRNANTVAIAARVALAIRDWRAELVIVDDTGHWGHGVIDNLTTAGLPVIPVVYSDPATSKRYKNRRAEMWLEMADWVKAGGALPDIPELVRELTVPTYTFVGGKFVLEDKDLVKARLGQSPDLADALAQTFALADMPGEMMQKLQGRQTTRHDFDPFNLEEQGHVAHDFNPFESR